MRYLLIIFPFDLNVQTINSTVSSTLHLVNTSHPFKDGLALRKNKELLASYNFRGAESFICLKHLSSSSLLGVVKLLLWKFPFGLQH